MSELTLTEFLLQRIAEDEAVADLATRMGMDSVATHSDLWNGSGHLPVMTAKRLKAECGAKRRIVDLHEMIDNSDFATIPFESYRGEQGCAVCDGDRDYGVAGHGPCETLRALAAVYADHPDYRAEWGA